MLISFFYTGYSQKLQEAGVPAAVKTKFASLYPGVKSIEWEKEDGNYEAEFKQDQTETSALFDASGSLVQTETEMAVTALPRGVLDYVSKNLNSKKITEAARIVDAGGQVTYEAEIGGRDYIFDAKGNFIKAEDDDPEDDEDNH